MAKDQAQEDSGNARKAAKANLEYLADAAFATHLVHEPRYASGAQFYEQVAAKAYAHLNEGDPNNMSKTSLPNAIAAEMLTQMQRDLAKRLAEGDAYAPVITRNRATEIATAVYMESLKAVTVGDLAKYLGRKVPSDVKDVIVGDLDEEKQGQVKGTYVRSTMDKKFAELYDAESGKAADAFEEIFKPKEEGEEPKKKKKK